MHGLPASKLTLAPVDIDGWSPSGGFEIADYDSRTQVLIGRLIASTCVALTMKGMLQPVGGGHTKQALAKAQGEEPPLIPSMFKLGKPISVDFRERIAEFMAGERVIYDGDGKSPYLSRYYITNRPTMPDGSDPFNLLGDPKEGAVWRTANVSAYLHHFHRGDMDRELHNHPWAWGLSLILVGGYREERRVGDRVVSRILKPGMLNWVGHDDFHRVDLLEKDAWTLFIVGRKVSSWGFWDRQTGGFKPWRQFLEDKRRVLTP